MVYVLLAEGFEEVEALTPVDLLRRAGVETRLVGVTGATVCGARGINVVTDLPMDEVDLATADMLILPGGMPGTTNLGSHAGVTGQIRKFYEEGKMIAAICAAPTVFGQMGLLEGREATCYPGLEEKLTGAKVVYTEVAVSDNVTTGRGPGKSIPFALSLVSQLLGQETADDLAKTLVYA